MTSGCRPFVPFGHSGLDRLCEKLKVRGFHEKEDSLDGLCQKKDRIGCRIIGSVSPIIFFKASLLTNADTTNSPHFPS